MQWDVNLMVPWSDSPQAAVNKPENDWMDC